MRKKKQWNCKLNIIVIWENIKILLKVSSHADDDSDEEEKPEITQWEAVGWLAALTLWISLLCGSC